MKLHLMNMVAASGAQGDEIEAVARKVREGGERITMALVEKTLSEIRGE